MSTWQSKSISELIDVFDSMRVPLSGAERSLRQGNFRYFGAQGVIDHIDAYIFDGEYLLVAEDGENLRTRKQPVAFKVRGKFWVNNHAHIVRAKNDQTTTDFLLYLLNHISLDAYITGAAQPKLSQGNLLNIKVNIPPLPIQKKIAGVLSAYDDLIETNLKRIKLLEEMAQITYEEWFVRHRFPGHETTPNNVETGLPEGWSEQKLDDIISVKHGYAFKGEYFSESPTNSILLTPGNFKIGGGLKLDKIKYYSDNAPIVQDFILESSDLLLTMTDLSKEGDTLGYPLLVPTYKFQFLHNQRLGKVATKKDFLPRYFLYHLFKSEGYRGFVVGSASGATVKHTSPGRILAFKTVMPTNTKLLMQFDQTVGPNFLIIDSLMQQNALLKEARDLLLPRLMTGIIDIDDYLARNGSAAVAA